jgi:hypothetical protein
MSARRSALVLGLLMGAIGCGYTSQYVPPVDGRARPLWAGDHVTNNLPQFARSRECVDAVYWVQHPEIEPQAEHFQPAPVVWVPRYWGADIVVATPGVAPILAHPVLFSPSLTVLQAAVAAGRSASQGGSTGGGNLGKEIALVIVVLAVVLVPIVDITVAALRPESDERSGDAIDQANVFNDLARSAGTPCSSP